MFWSRKRQPVPPDVEHRLAHLEAQVLKVQSELRQLDGEQILLHDQVRKWMRRAVAAERHQEPEHVNGSPPSPATPAPPPRRLWGARGRRLARLAAETQEQQATEE